MDREMRTLDWAALERFIEERKPVEVSAGILNDWFWTAATVWENGAWTDGKDRAYVTSYWAQPGFKATMPNGDVIEVAADRPETPDDIAAREARKAQLDKDMKDLAAKLELRRESSATK